MNISNLCIDIKKYFSDKKTDFGENLFNEVKKETINFSKNLTFFDLKNKIDDDYLDFILYFYCQHNKNLFFIIVWPVTYNFDQIIKDCYNQYGNIIFKKEIKLNDNGITNILKLISNKATHPKGKELWFAEPHRTINPLTIYLFETKKNDVKENEIFDYLVQIFNNNKDYISNIQKSEGLNNLYCTTKVKRECRELLKNNNCVSPISFAPDKNYSHHVNDEHWETIEMSRVFFNNNTLNYFNNIRYNSLPLFSNKFNLFLNFLKNNSIILDNILIYNSSVLAPFGLREPSDIDFIQGGENFINQNKLPNDIDIQNKYFKRGFMILETESKSTYMEDNEFFMINEPIDSLKFKWTLSLDDIIYNPKNYFFYKNIKFMDLIIFKKVKNIRNRLKDLEQIKILEKNNF